MWGFELVESRNTLIRQFEYESPYLLRAFRLLNRIRCSSDGSILTILAKQNKTTE